MAQEEKSEAVDPGPMHRRRLILPDGRYEIFYTFGTAAPAQQASDEEGAPEPQPKPEVEASSGV